MRFLILDFEAKDGYIARDLGAGWAFAINYPYASLFYPIGFSYCYYDSEDGTLSQSQYFQLSTKSLQDSIVHNNHARLRDLIQNTKNIVCHNAQYDLGCLLSLGISIKHLRVYDTLVLAKLYDSTLWSYSLGSLLKKYRLGQKESGSLGDVVKRHDLLLTAKGNKPNTETKTYEKRAKDYAYANMDIIQEKEPETMAFYANQDTFGTGQLFKLMYPKIGDKLSHFYSNIQKICTEIRAPGIVVSMAAIERGIDIITPVWTKLQEDLYRMLGTELNLNASKDQLSPRLVEMGYKLPLTDTGNPSCNKEFLEEHPNDPLCQAISKYRTTNILLRDFLIKTKDMQQYSCPDLQSGGDYGRVFPELNLLAARTGRFSSSNPNIQNIPKRDKEFAKLCRAIFVPANRENNWYSLDWSNQEGRLQLHYANLMHFSKAKEWLKRFKDNPKIDTHEIVAEMMFKVKAPLKSDPARKEFDRQYRTPAKTIYLGKSFCMGGAKLCKRLGLPTAMVDYGRGPMEGAGTEGQKLIDLYDRAFPYLKELQKSCAASIVEKGYIRTLGGRRAKRPPPIKGRLYDYKAISLLIQGSAADQMYAALTMAHEAGIDIKCIVHDEFNIEGQHKDAKIMQEIMETCVDIMVPSVAEVAFGSSWGNLEELKNEV